MLDDALSLSLSFSVSHSLSISLSHSLSLSLSEIYAQPPVDGYFLTYTTTQDGILSPILLYICIYDYPYNATWRGKHRY